MRRKMVALFMCACMVFALAACSAQDESDESEDAQLSEDEDAVTGSEEDLDEEETDDADAVISEEGEMEVSLAFYENENIAINGTNISLDDEGNVTLTLGVMTYDDQEWTVSVKAVEFNNLQVNKDAVIWAEAGTTQEDDIELAYYGAFTDVSEITQVGLNIYAWSDDYTEYVEETVIAYTDGEENAVDYSRESSGSDVILFDTEDVTVTAVGFAIEGDVEYFPEYNLILYVENHGTSDWVMLSSSDESVNGVSLENATDAYLTEDYVYCGNSCYARLTIDEDDAGISSVSDVESIGFTLSVNGWEVTDWEENLGNVLFSLEDDFLLEY